MKRPSFQFYPGDWQANSNLRRCTHAEKGVWLDVMCLMHDQTEYGVLRWPLKEIAQAVGASVALLRGLAAKGVLKGSDSDLADSFIYVPRSGRKDGEPVTLLAPQAGPIWYSSRMVKDEYVRTIRGESSRFGGDEDEAPKDAPKVAFPDAPKPPFGDGSSSSFSSSKKKTTSSSAGPTVPCPYDSIVDLYHRALPDLPRVRLMPDARQRALRKLWGWILSSSKPDGTRRATTAEEALAWVGSYFERAAANDFLMGRGERSGAHANWRCDLDFLLTDKGMRHVIEKTAAAA
jgi:hypothetical protein